MTSRPIPPSATKVDDAKNAYTSTRSSLHALWVGFSHALESTKIPHIHRPSNVFFHVHFEVQTPRYILPMLPDGRLDHDRVGVFNTTPTDNL